MSVSKVWLVLVVVFSFLLISCNSSGPESPGNYYTGSEGVRINFLPNSPPPVIYHRPNTPDADFSIDVEVFNKGSSITRGGLFVSGYSESFVTIEGVSPLRPVETDCTFSVSALAGNHFQGFWNCYGTQGSVINTENWRVRIDEFSQIFNLIGLDDQGQWLDDHGVVVSVDIIDGNPSATLGFNNPDSYQQYMYRGGALLMLLAHIDYSRYYGQQFLLRGNTPVFPGGESTIMTFNAHIADELPPGRNEYPIDFLVTSCYSYATYASPLICLDPDPYSGDDKVCTAGQVQHQSTQGAPVAISNVRTEYSPGIIAIQFTIQNVGGGTIYDPGYLERCSPYYLGKVSPMQKDIVYIASVMAGTTPLECTPRNRVVLENGRGMFTCYYNTEEAGVTKSGLQQSFNVELWYGYSDTIQKKIMLKRIRPT